MKFKELKLLLKMDEERWNGENKFLKKIISPEYKIVHRLRWCSYLSSKKIFFLFFIFEWLRYKSIAQKFGCDINIHTKIAGGLRIYHPQGIIINDKSLIGVNCTLRSGCVIGENHNGVPIIGNDVNFGVHCIVIGGIKIGNCAVIGAGSICTHDVPDNAIVYGQGAEVKKIKTSGITKVIY